jgi:hypothetical protein
MTSDSTRKKRKRKKRKRSPSRQLQGTPKSVWRRLAELEDYDSLDDEQMFHQAAANDSQESNSDLESENDEVSYGQAKGGSSSFIDDLADDSDTDDTESGEPGEEVKQSKYARFSHAQLKEACRSAELPVLAYKLLLSYHRNR